MNRTPRRPPRIQAPLRGRSAAVPPFDQVQLRPLPIAPQRPPISGSFAAKEPRQVVIKTDCSLAHCLRSIKKSLRQLLRLGDR
jgi:hypothetical protein